MYSNISLKKNLHLSKINLLQDNKDKFFNSLPQLGVINAEIFATMSTTNFELYNLF